MSCTACGGDRLYQFEASSEVRARPGPEQMPVICRSCGQVTLGGQVVPFPREIKDNMLAAAEKAATEAQEELVRDPEQAIDGYFIRVYQRAYLDGFWRALAYHKHNQKDGRLHRLRELWKTHYVKSQSPALDSETGEDTSDILALWEEKPYNEFKQLLALGESDVSSPENLSPPVPQGSPRV